MLTEEMPPKNRRRDGTAASVAAVSPSVASRERRILSLDAGERALRRSVERGEWAHVGGLPAAKDRCARYAKATLRNVRKA